MTNVVYGYMGTTLNKTMADLRVIGHLALFTEIQIHGNLKDNIDLIRGITPPLQYEGYFTIHGEGETDGKIRIRLCSNDNSERKQYVKDSIALYSVILDNFASHKIFRVILHPDTLSSKSTRKKQIEVLATSLTEIADKLEDIESVCIEPRGGDLQRKVLRTTIEDIKILEEYLNLNGKSRIGLCIDIAQAFIVYGNMGMVRFLDELQMLNLPVKEFHISDVYQHKKVTNRVAMEIGTGFIDWQLIFPLLLQHCNELLIETLGGIKVFQRSKLFLESL